MVEIGDEQVDLVEREHSGPGLGAELAVIDGEDDTAAGRGEGALDRSFLETGLRRAEHRVEGPA